MSNDAFADRRQELEESFFKEKNAQLLQKMKTEYQQLLDKEAIAKVSGITHPGVIERLVALHLNAETLAALSIFPLTEVAWADGACDEKEKKAVLEAAHQAGIVDGSGSHQLIANWLELKPPAALHLAWFNYVRALCEKISVDEKALLKNELLGRARAVAEASGGFLGMGNKVSQAESQMLTKLEDAFK